MYEKPSGVDNKQPAKTKVVVGTWGWEEIDHQK